MPIASVRAFALVSLIALGAATLNALYSTALSSPWIVPDELIYAELAKSIGDGGFPAIRERVTLGYGPLYPLILAPAWAIFEDPAAAYAAAKIVNAFLMSAAAFPAFYLARRFVGVNRALVVAGLSVFVPAMVYTQTLMTEVVVYPVFLTAVLFLVAALERPTTSTDLFLVGSIVVSCAVKPIFVILVPAYVLALIHLGWIERRTGGGVRARLRASQTGLALLGSIAVLATVVPALLGDITGVLGVYGVVVGNVDFAQVPVWGIRHLASIDLYVVIAPFAAALVLIASTFRGIAEPRVARFAVVTSWVTVLLVLAVSAYASKPSAGAEGFFVTEARLHERNISFVAPLLLIGLALLLERGGPAWTRRDVFCVVLSGLLPLVLPVGRLLHNVNFQAPALFPWASHHDLWPYSFLPLAALVSTLFLTSGPRVEGVLWSLIGVVFLLTTTAVHESMRASSDRTQRQGIGSDTRWIDRVVPPDTSVVAIWSERPGTETVLPDSRHRALWLGEFFNRSVGEVVELGRPMPYALPHIDGELRGGMLVDGEGSKIIADYVLVPCWIRVKGDSLSRNASTGARLVLTPGGPLRLTVRSPGSC